MTTLTSTNLARFANVFSAQIRQRLAVGQKQLGAEIASRAAEEKKQRLELAARERREAEGLAKRIPLARKGLACILAAGCSKPMQKTLEMKGKLGQACIKFYQASRPSGERGTRDVDVYFLPDCIEICYGSFGVWGTKWQLFYDAPLEEVAQRQEGTNEEEPRTNLDAFLHEIASPYSADMWAARHCTERTYEWDPANIAFQLFVSCSRKSRFENYLMQCIAEIKI